MHRHPYSHMYLICTYVLDMYICAYYMHKCMHAHNYMHTDVHDIYTYTYRMVTDTCICMHNVHP